MSGQQLEVVVGHLTHACLLNKHQLTNEQTPELKAKLSCTIVLTFVAVIVESSFTFKCEPQTF